MNTADLERADRIRWSLASSLPYRQRISVQQPAAADGLAGRHRGRDRLAPGAQRGWASNAARRETRACRRTCRPSARVAPALWLRPGRHPTAGTITDFRPELSLDVPTATGTLTFLGMSASTGSGSQTAKSRPQRQMYRELREQASEQQRQRQQKIARLVQEHGQRALKTFRHPSR